MTSGSEVILFIGFCRKSKMVAKKSQNGPHGTIIRDGNIKILLLGTLRNAKMLVRKIYPWGAWGPLFPTRLIR